MTTIRRREDSELQTTLGFNQLSGVEGALAILPEMKELLKEIQRSDIIIAMDKAVAKVEDRDAKLEVIRQRIEKLLSPNPVEATQNLAMRGNQNRNTANGISLEEHPLLPKTGGMPLEIDQIPLEWRNELDKIQDQSELQNQLKKKLQAKLQQTLKAVNKLKNTIKPGSQPKLRHSNSNRILVKFNQTLEQKEKLILQIQQKLEDTPKFVPPKLTPY